MICTTSYECMIGINIRVKSQQALLANIKISLKLFGYMLIIGNYDKTSAFAFVLALTI